MPKKCNDDEPKVKKRRGRQPAKAGKGKMTKKRHELFAHKLIQNQGNVQKTLVDIMGPDHYKTKASLDNAATMIMKQPDIKERIQEIMHMIYTPEELHHDIQEIRQATKPIVFEGVKTDTHPDYGVRLDLLKLYMKVSGVANSDTPTSQTNVQFNVASVDHEAALKIAREISALSQSITPDKSGRRN